MLADAVILAECLGDQLLVFLVEGSGDLVIKNASLCLCHWILVHQHSSSFAGMQQHPVIIYFTNT